MRVEVNGVSYSAGGRQILDDVSLTLTPGELVSVVGPNGAGKSTLLRIVAGQLSPDSGGVTIDGDAPNRIAPASLATRLSYLGPRPRQDLAFTAREVVAMGRHPHRHQASATDDEVAVVAAMQSLDLAGLESAVMHTLSTGEAQRVGLARSLAQSAPIMLLDEPTGALDVAHQVMAMDALRGRARGGTGVLCVLHDLNLAARSADRIVLLDRGSVAALGTPRQVLRADLLSNVYEQQITVIDHPTEDRPLVVV